MKNNTLRPELLQKMDAYWRAANYVAVGQIYLYDNPLLRRSPTLAAVKHMLLGYWGTTPGQDFIYVHLNRVSKKYDLDMIYVSGPGPGGPAEALSPVLVSRRDSQPRVTGVPGLDPRGRRAGPFAQPFLRGGVRQSRPGRGLRCRRWRGGNGSAGHGVALMLASARTVAVDARLVRVKDSGTVETKPGGTARTWLGDRAPTGDGVMNHGPDGEAGRLGSGAWLCAVIGVLVVVLQVVAIRQSSKK